MKTRNYLASLILALCFNPANASDGALATLVRAWREAPTPTHLTAINSYIATHPKEAPLAHLALGISAYEQHNYAAAIPLLKPLPLQLPAVADYAAYYLAAARVEAADATVTAADLALTRREAVPSPFAARSWILEARALKAANPEAAIQLLLSHYQDLPQPDADVTLADSYQAANNLPRAADYYQRVYFGYLTGDAATHAASALFLLKNTMGAAYPEPSGLLKLRRADRILEARDYLKAKSEYAALAATSDAARVRIGAADYQRGATNLAWPYLRDLTVPEGEADAERLYYLVECARQRNDDGDLQSALHRLADQYPKSSWRLRALTSAVNRYLLVNRTEDYVPLSRAIYEDFPTSPAAGLAHWRVTFQDWLHDRPDARVLLREQLRSYPTHSSAGAALYFMGRGYEQIREFGSARACYQRLAGAFENTYYAMLARGRLRAPEIASATPSADVTQDRKSTRLNSSH